jgi:hypothetical protein
LGAGVEQNFRRQSVYGSGEISAITVSKIEPSTAHWINDFIFPTWNIPEPYNPDPLGLNRIGYPQEEWGTCPSELIPYGCSYFQRFWFGWAWQIGLTVYMETCPDVNGDDWVTIVDAFLVTKSWVYGWPYGPRYDVDSNESINILDSLRTAKAAFGIEGARECLER